MTDGWLAKFDRPGIVWFVTLGIYATEEALQANQEMWMYLERKSGAYRERKNG